MKQLRYHIRLYQAKRTFWGKFLEVMGGKPAPQGMLRRPKNTLFFLKWAEHEGLFD